MGCEIKISKYKSLRYSSKRVISSKVGDFRHEVEQCPVFIRSKVYPIWLFVRPRELYCEARHVIVYPRVHWKLWDLSWNQKKDRICEVMKSQWGEEVSGRLRCATWKGETWLWCVKRSLLTNSYLILFLNLKYLFCLYSKCGLVPKNIVFNLSSLFNKFKHLISYRM